MAVNDLDVIRVVAEMEMLGSEDVDNIFHVLKVSGGTIPDQTLMDDVANQLEVMYTFLLPVQRIQYTYTQITGQKVFGGTDLMPDTSWPVLTAGASSTDGLPLQIAALIAGQTTRPRVQGRKYLGGFLETANVDGDIGATLITPLLNWGINYIVDWVLGANTYRFGTFNPTTAVFNAFSSALIGGVFRTQRRRTKGFGS